VNHGSHFGIEVGSKTDIGRVRQNNEDTFAVAQGINLWVVSDGIGGEKHGELASAIAIETIVASCRSNSLLPPISTVHWSTSQSEAIVIECHLPGKPRDIQFRQPQF
jgi:serine/threonine protein phosphatase PrpC